MTLASKSDNLNSSIRLECIDIFRGLTMALMLMVNNPGKNEPIRDRP
ncbi:hypothetical protein UNSWDHB_2565 [Dehalobacter sp. UNSWDHB]|jgi:hypothetical protein|nr:MULTISPECIES: hypothetical protein [unclassified Dehalobacter]AFV03453.1 hypothetical protein DHBDCA_p2426 [Dehalobacter sp. DCA]AFV06440.1 hypothetical protein DCF50_p2437 [Dehalobacter sp. CF]EQB20096.1 hypothetical protein UNSWDHB_2565 [Dehalobacter sp. UNSWDHB]